MPVPYFGFLTCSCAFVSTKVKNCPCVLGEGTAEQSQLYKQLGVDYVP